MLHAYHDQAVLTVYATLGHYRTHWIRPLFNIQYRPIYIFIATFEMSRIASAQEDRGGSKPEGVLSRENCDSGVMMELEDCDSDNISEDVPLPPMSSCRSMSRLSKASSWNVEESIEGSTTPNRPSQSTHSWSAGDNLPKKASTPEDVRLFNDMQRQRRVVALTAMQAKVYKIQEQEYDNVMKKKHQKRLEEEHRQRQLDERNRNLAIRGYLPGVKESKGWLLLKSLEAFKDNEKLVSQMLLEAMGKSGRRTSRNSTYSHAASIQNKNRHADGGDSSTDDTLSNDTDTDLREDMPSTSSASESKGLVPHTTQLSQSAELNSSAHPPKSRNE